MLEKYTYCLWKRKMVRIIFLRTNGIHICLRKRQYCSDKEASGIYFCNIWDPEKGKILKGMQKPCCAYAPLAWKGLERRTEREKPLCIHIQAQRFQIQVPRQFTSQPRGLQESPRIKRLCFYKFADQASVTHNFSRLPRVMFCSLLKRN